MEKGKEKKKEADDAVATSTFGIYHGITFNEDSIQLLLHGAFEVLIRFSFGIFFGPIFQNKDYSSVGFFPLLIVFCGGLDALCGAHQIQYDGTKVLVSSCPS